MQLDYLTIRRRISFADVLALIDYEPTEVRGSQWRGACPLCQSDSPGDVRCFSVNTQRQLFQCFRCQASGNSLDFWMAFSGQPLYQATHDLCTRLKITPVERPNPQPRNRR